MDHPPTVLELFAFATVLALSVVGGLMGLRIFRNAQKGGGSAEKWVGLALMLVCGGGYIPLIIGQFVGQPELRFLLVGFGIGAAHVGVACVFVFTRRVFRPDVVWLHWAVRLLIAGLVLTWLSGLVVVNWPLRAEPPHEAIAAGLPWAFVSNLLSGIGMAWSTVEALRQWSLSRKRARLGLADPLVANRMLLWSIFTGASVATTATHGFCVAALGIDPGEVPLAIAITAFDSLLSSVALWLSFLPPQAWIRRIRGSGAAA